MKKQTIENIEEGSLVTDGSEFAKVEYCAHDNKFYALRGSEKELVRDGYTAEEIAAAVEVSDWDEAQAEECCG